MWMPTQYSDLSVALLLVISDVWQLVNPRMLSILLLALEGVAVNLR